MTQRKARQKAAGYDLIGALGEAGWAEADRALAAALAEVVVVELALSKLSRTKSAAALRKAQDGFALLSQSLETVARKRGAQRFGEVGAIEKFDRRKHEIDGAVRAAARVRVLAPGVVKGEDVLVKARVKLAPARKPAKAKRGR
ncbi:hypothetical protein U91I_00020 [alpha proteobacterium U9-1i]|nr:hypothetical protein U91I_00020 [alpha proteobacterium U9-1i]